MSWIKRKWEKLKYGEIGKEGHGKKKTVKMIDGHELTIVLGNGKDALQLRNPQIKPLWKIYQWYLTKDSEKYNVVWDKGMKIIHRHDITSMSMEHKKIFDKWSKDDETKE